MDFPASEFACNDPHIRVALYRQIEPGPESYMIPLMSKSKTNHHGTMASRADKYDLYLRSVQEPDHEVAFFQRVYRQACGQPPQVLREDFCGTFAVCCSWVRRKPDRQAIGVDLDPEPLNWGTRHNLAKLSEVAQQRVQLIQDDVRTVCGPKADVVAAQNFSFCIFKTRDDLRRYFRAAYRNLRKYGVLVLDMVGGSEAIEEEHEDIERYNGFTYVWEQHRFDPITHNFKCFIHFRFRDGSELRRAFSYEWRLWSIPEIRELLAEAGFKRTDVYWEDTDSDTGEGKDIYRRREHAASDPAWVAYIVGVK